MTRKEAPMAGRGNRKAGNAAIEPYIRMPFAYLRTPFFRTLAPRQRDVFALMLMYSALDKATPAGCVRVSMRQIGKDLDMQPSQVSRNIEVLIEKGAIFKVGAGEGRGRNTYRLAQPARIVLEPSCSPSSVNATGASVNHLGVNTTADGAGNGPRSAAENPENVNTTGALCSPLGVDTVPTPQRGESQQDSLSPSHDPRQLYSGTPDDVPAGFVARCPNPAGYEWDEAGNPVERTCGRRLVPYSKHNPATKDHRNDWWCPGCYKRVSSREVWKQL